MEIIRGMSDTDYHAHPGASASRLKAILRSPLHLRAMQDAPLESDALRLGTALHTMVLECDQFVDSYAVTPEGIDRRTKDGKAQYETFVANNDGKVFLSAEEARNIVAMTKSINHHPTASELLHGRTETEVSLFWDQNGVPCKCRMDAVNGEWRAIVDLKTTVDASPNAWTRSLANFKYHVQAAWYIDAAHKAGFEVDSVIFIAVEKTYPHAVACYRIDEVSIGEGRRACDRALRMYADCLRTGIYPGYSDGILDIGLSTWAFTPEMETL
jgi:exodeoxyribonuclease VIII